MIPLFYRFKTKPCVRQNLTAGYNNYKGKDYDGIFKTEEMNYEKK
ncbi:hypothetical protein BACEGG_01937 [Bacteroides eggerthii DSM 20697]|nr:hypothetical protein BACEGG_01937 [Bacteroides eggerthii DSM 20697]